MTIQLLQQYAAPVGNKCFYKFKAVDNQLELSLKLPTANFTPFLEVLEVLDIYTAFQPQIQMDFKNFELKVKFDAQFNNQSINFIKSIIIQLHSMSIPELHENKDALWFYSHAEGLEILNNLNYTVELKKFLSDEQELFKSYITQNSYKTIIEVGCGVGENLSLAVSKDNQLNYIGLDFSANKIINFKKKLQQQPSKNLLSNPEVKLDAKCMDVIQFLDKENVDVIPDKAKSIVIFPFNVFGNIAPISLLLCKLKAHSLDFLISIYKNDEDTIAMRQAYYKNCDYETLEVTEDETGVCFHSNEGLYTVAYDQKYITNLISAIGFKVNVSESQYGIMVHGYNESSDYSNQNLLLGGLSYDTIE